MSTYILGEPQVPWGDYGSILVSGMSCHLPRKEGLIQFERTAPFVPPISLPGLGDIVVTDAFKRALESSELTGMSFQPVIKARIVHFEWEKWDQTADEPEEYPDEGEPEGYILDRPHKPELAEEMGELWEVCLEEHAEVERVKVGRRSWDVDIYVLGSSWDGTDLFRAKGVGFIYVSEKARNWLQKTVAEWVSSEPAMMK
jgi:hypothetical protein